jgi:hypothetical protein
VFKFCTTAALLLHVLKKLPFARFSKLDFIRTLNIKQRFHLTNMCVCHAIVTNRRDLKGMAGWSSVA